VIVAGIALTIVDFCKPGAMANYPQVIAHRGTVNKVYVGSNEQLQRVEAICIVD